jgi:hypothetical protein
MMLIGHEIIVSACGKYILISKKTNATHITAAKFSELKPAVNEDPK